MWQKLNKYNGEESVRQTLGSNPTQKQDFLTGNSIPGFSKDVQLVQTNVQHGVPACPNKIEPYDFFSYGNPSSARFYLFHPGNSGTD